MDENGTAAYYGGTDGHFNPEGLYTGEQAEYGEQNFEGNFGEFQPTVEEYEANNEFTPFSHVIGDYIKK